jgi:CheY-specific phosphatase CheX
MYRHSRTKVYGENKEIRIRPHKKIKVREKNADVPSIMIKDMEDMIKSAANEVFATMLNMSVTFEHPDIQMQDSQTHVAGAVGFTGKFNGVIYLYSNLEFARKMTCCLLGLTDDQIEGNEMINDVVGELTNMHAGHLKSRLSDRGQSCVITIPAVVSGRDFRIEPVSGAERYAVCVRANKNCVLLEMLVKPE